MNLTPASARREEHAARTGVTLDRVESVALELKHLRDLGTLVDIDVTGLSMFSTQASYAELGIPEGDRRASRLHRGSKDLIPSEYIRALRSLAVRFRTSLERHSFPIEGFRPYRWVPFTAYEAWKADYERLQEELTKQRQAIIDNYDSFVDQLIVDFTEIAHEAYTAIRARDGEFAEPEHEFVAGIVNRALAKLPSKERIQGSVAVDYRTAFIQNMTDLEQERAQADATRTARELEWAEVRKAQAEAQIAEQRSWNMGREAAQHEREREVKLAAMRQAELEHARKQLAEAVSPLQEVFSRLRAQMFADVQEILAVVKRHGHLPGKTAEKARGLLETFRLMNVHGDQQLESLLQNLTANLRPLPAGGETKYDVNAVTAALTEVSSLTHQAAQEIAQMKVGRAAFLELE